MYLKRFVIYSFSLLSVFLLLGGCCSGKNRTNEHNVSTMVRRGNVVYDISELETGAPHLPLFVSNGIVGACFDHMGFQSRPTMNTPEGRTVLGYIGHYTRVEPSTRQIQYPIAYIEAVFADGTSILNLMDANDYRQELDIYTGILTTEYDLFGKTKIQALAHQSEPNLFVMQIDRKSALPEKNIVLKIKCETSATQNSRWGIVNAPEVTVRTEDNRAYITSITNISVTEWIVDGDNPVTFENNTLVIPLLKEQNTLKIAFKHKDCSAPEQLLTQSFDEMVNFHKAVWADVWSKSWMDLPDDRGQKIWTRMKYYAISNFPMIEEKPIIPTGLNSNIWGFTFPQDVYYVAENLPRLGHIERSAKALDYWLTILPEVQKYTRRIMDRAGAFYPWTPPFTEWDSYEVDGVVVHPDSYELHNSAYVLAIAWHHYQRTGDKEALKRYFPIIEEVTRFYVEISEPNAKGNFDVYHDNSRGQDEASSTAGKLRNLLCAIFSAEYSLRTYLEAAMLLGDVDPLLLEKIKEINAKGYDREILLRPEGIYTTYASDTRPFGRQKHPVQLNPIAYLPMPDLVQSGSPAEKAWINRYELTIDAKKPVTRGWTIGEFALASCRMRDAEAVEKDLSAIQLCRSADPRWIQFYESSSWEGSHLRNAYYFPMMALYLQMYTDALVQDWRGYVDIFPCLLKGWDKSSFAFHGIHVTGGAVIDGTWNNGKFKVTITPGTEKDIMLMVTPEAGRINAKGQENGPASFRSGEQTMFTFSGSRAIVLSN